MLLTLTAAFVILTYRELSGPGSFLGGLGIGVPVVGLCAEWIEYPRPRKP